MNGRVGVAFGTGIAAGALAVSGLVPAIGAIGEDVPDVVFLARSDVAADALAAGPVAAQFGAPLLTTRPSSLADSAATALGDLSPELVILLGGEGAISTAVESAAADACSCTVRRVFGSAREDTAAEISTLLAEYGLMGPVVAGATRTGDAGLSGALEVGTLGVAGATMLGANDIHLPLDGTPTANGAALRDAVAALAGESPATVHLGPGTADLGTTGLDLPDGLSLQGSGVGHTTITGDPTGTEAAAGLLRPVEGAPAEPTYVLVQDLTLEIDAEVAGYAYSILQADNSWVSLETVDITVLGSGPGTITAGIVGTDISRTEMRTVEMNVVGGGGTGGGVVGGNIDAHESDIRVLKGPAVPTIDAVSVFFVRSYALANGGSGGPTAIRTSNRTFLKFSETAGGVESTGSDVFLDQSTVDAVTADGFIRSSMSRMDGPLSWGDPSSCIGSYNSANERYLSSCLTPS